MQLQEAGQLTGPLRDRFGIMLNLELYSIEPKIITRSAGILGIEISKGRSDRNCKTFSWYTENSKQTFKKSQRFCPSKEEGIIDLQTSKDGLDILEVDELGLDTIDRKIILTIIDNFLGGPVGVDTIAASTGEERVTIEDVYEPLPITNRIFKQNKQRKNCNRKSI